MAVLWRGSHCLFLVDGSSAHFAAEVEYLKVCALALASSAAGLASLLLQSGVGAQWASKSRIQHRSNRRRGKRASASLFLFL